MKSTGMIRKVDELGRVVIPIELRRSLDIKERDAIEIHVDEDEIVLKKYVPDMACQITGESKDDNISLADGKVVLSPEGAKTLVDEISKHFDVSN
ncbi:MAG TPA: AbrB/MazE/SpoVT family DNA-binding domain-containing protein [Pseudogracilibacillus sp.]|nr:AbrB/MazE/SpoVT family DNA-binding domain-containing protein [Pseudogracilibacillus sp.]